MSINCTDNEVIVSLDQSILESKPSTVLAAESFGYLRELLTTCVECVEELSCELNRLGVLRQLSSQLAESEALDLISQIQDLGCDSSAFITQVAAQGVYLTPEQIELLNACINELRSTIDKIRALQINIDSSVKDLINKIVSYTVNIKER